MKRISFLAIFAMLLAACANQAPSENTTTTKTTEVKQVEGETPGKIVFAEDFHDFGKLEAGEIVSYTFKFKNEGKSTLIVKQVRPSCGCTEPKFTKTPIAPGGTGEVELGFDSDGFRGLQNKSARVITNGNPSDVVLHFSAVVE